MPTSTTNLSNVPPSMDNQPDFLRIGLHVIDVRKIAVIEMIGHLEPDPIAGLSPWSEGARVCMAGADSAFFVDKADAAALLAYLKSGFPFREIPASGGSAPASG